MATRLYFPRSNLPPAAFRFNAALNGYWDTVRATTTALCTLAKTGFTDNPEAAYSWLVTVGTGTNPNTAMFGQWVSPALAAQTLSGTVGGVFKSGENDTLLNARSNMRIYVVDSTGALVHTLYDGDAGGAGNEFPVLGTYTTRIYPRASDQGLTSYACADQDRLVIEPGATIHGTPTGKSIGINIGADSNYGDATYNEFTSGYTNGWLEFSGTFTWYTAPTGGARSVAAVAMG